MHNVSKMCMYLGKIQAHYLCVFWKQVVQHLNQFDSVDLSSTKSQSMAEFATLELNLIGHFPSFLMPLFQNESKGKTFLVKMSKICI